MFDIPLISRLGAVCINLDVMRTSRYSSDSSSASSIMSVPRRAHKVDELNMVNEFLADTSNEKLAIRIVKYRDGGCTISPAEVSTKQSHIIPKRNIRTVRALISTDFPMLIVCTRVVGVTLRSSGDSETFTISTHATLSHYIPRLTRSLTTRRTDFSSQ